MTHNINQMMMNLVTNQKSWLSKVDIESQSERQNNNRNDCFLLFFY